MESDIGRRRRDRAVEALERLDGVVAASVQLGAGARVDAVRLATAAGTGTEDVRERAIAVLRELGFELDHQAVLIAPIGGTPAPQPPQWQQGAQPAASTPSPQAPPSTPLPQQPVAAAGPTPVPATDRQAGPTPPGRIGESRPPGDLDDDSALPPSFVDEQAPPPPWHGRFLVLDGVDVTRSETRVTCTVRLKRLGESFSAQVTELDTPQGRARAAARAALEAAEQSGEGIGLSLEGVVIQEFFGRQHVMAFVDGVAHRKFASLSGILAVEQSLETAAALAILRAVERWVAW